MTSLIPEKTDLQNSCCIFVADSSFYEIFDMYDEEIEYDTDNEPEFNDCPSSILTFGCSLSTSSMETPNSALSQFSTPTLSPFSPNTDSIENVNIQKSSTVTPLETIDEIHISQKQKHKYSHFETPETITTIDFIHNYITNDTLHMFDQYICQAISDPNQTVDNDSTVSIQTPEKPNKKTKHITWDKFDDIYTLHTLSINTPIPVASFEQNKLIAISSTTGWNNGVHEWSIKVLQCDIGRKEVGVVSAADTGNTKMDSRGITCSDHFGARAVYGNQLQNNSSYYASYNHDGSERCYKNLSNDYNIGWTTGDVIKVCLNLDKWKIKFYLNGQKVRKTLSLEPGHMYYPIISFSGHCTFVIVN